MKVRILHSLSNLLTKVCLVFLLAIPSTSVSQTQVRQLWGTTSAGGENGLGVIYKVNADGTGLTVQKSFLFTTEVKDANPAFFSLTLASNGKLYGMTTAGSKNMGGLFEFDLSNFAYSGLYSFSGADGQNPGIMLTQASNGKLYGTTLSGGTNGRGTIFEYDLQTRKQAVLYNFPPDVSSNGIKLTELNGKLYGTVAGAPSSIFEFDPSNQSVTTKYTFTGNISTTSPGRGLTIGPDGKLYGVTIGGGTNGGGVLYQFDPATSVFVVEKEFNTVSGVFPLGLLTDGGNGKLYGTAPAAGANNSGTLFEFDPATGALVTKVDFAGASNGSTPVCTLNLASNGKLYGLARAGGSFGNGTFFEFDPPTGILTKKIDLNFPLSGNGEGQLTQAPNGKIYGMLGGGAADTGYIFEYDPVTGNSTNRFDFGSAGNGAAPPGELTLAPNNKFYGVTQSGGATNQGVVYELDPVSLAFSVKVNFSGLANGAVPVGRMIIGSNGKMYGTTSLGGASNRGIVYEFDYTTGILTKKADFSSTVGSFMEAGLTEASNGKMFGAGRNSGINGYGTLFEFNPTSGALTKLLDFNSATTGANTQGQPNLAVAPNGKLYGTTPFGGSNTSPNGGGTIYEIDPAAATYTKKVDMGAVSTDLAGPKGSFVLADNGNFYALAAAGGVNGKGGIFEYVPGATTITKKYDFPATFGNTYLGAMAKSTNGKLYGTVTGSGAFSQGLLFEFDPATSAFTTKFDFDIVNGASPYKGSLVLGALVTVPSQTITFNALQATTFGSAPFQLNATASSSMPVSYDSSNPEVATINGNTVTIIGVGITIITATQAGNANYLSAPSIPQTLTVNKASQTIAFSAIPDKTVTDAPFGATATSTSSLTVSFATISDKVTISGSQITLAKPGRVSVTASQAGNLSFIPATNVVQSFCIKPVKPTVTVTGAATATATLTSSATSGNQWYFNGSPIAAATGQTLNAMLGGIYKVQVSADDCVSDFSADQVVVITGDLSKEFRSDVIVYPNPARTLLVVSLPDVLERKIVSVYHSDGREVDHAETQGREISFQVSGYSRGLYLVKVTTDKSLYTARFVKE